MFPLHFAYRASPCVIRFQLNCTYTDTYGYRRHNRVCTSEQRAAVSKTVFIVRVMDLNWLLADKVHSQVQDRRSHQVQYSLHKKTVTFPLLPWCQSPQIYIPLIQNYVWSLNAHMLYLLYRCLKILSVGMTYSVYCGIQDRGLVGRFPEGGPVSSRLQNIQTFLGPAQPPFKLMNIYKCSSVGKTVGAWRQSLTSVKYRG